MNDLLEAYTSGWNYKHYETIYDWARDNISLPAGAFAIPGPFEVNRSKYLIEPFNSLKNPKIRTVSICKAVQSAGSLLAQIYLPWAMIHKKGTMLYLTQGDESAKILADTRIQPILRNIDQFKSMLPKHSKQALKNMTVTLDTVNVLIRGAKEKFVQSNSCIIVIGDECWQFKKGIMEQARSRVTKFPNTHKILWVSQADEVDTDWHVEYNKGIVYEWHWECPKCKAVQPYYWDKLRADNTWAGVIWDKVLYPDGTTDIFKTAATARISCYGCKHEIADTPINRKQMMDSGKYVCIKTSGDPSRISFNWNSMAAIDIPIRFDPLNPGPSLVVQYLQAKEQQKIGNLIPFKTFWLQQLAKFWDESDAERQYIVAMQSYDIKSDWKDEKYRVMTIDCQKDLMEFWYVIRAWSATGESRQLAFGKCDTFEQLREKQVELKVQDQLVFVDSGYNTSKVYNQCVKYGHIVNLPSGQKQYVSWNATKGSPSRDFPHNDPNSNQPPDRRIYAKKQWVDPLNGLPANPKQPAYKVPLWLYSTNSVKDILRKLRDGKSFPFLVPMDSKQYTEQMNSEILRKVKNKKTGHAEWIWVQVKQDNHAWDLEGMQIVSQVILGNLKL